jgi:hypothetical protein
MGALSHSARRSDCRYRGSIMESRTHDGWAMGAGAAVFGSVAAPGRSTLAFAEVGREGQLPDLEQHAATWMRLDTPPEVWLAVADGIGEDPVMAHVLRLSHNEIAASEARPEVRQRDDVPTWAAGTVEAAVHRHRDLEALFDRMASTVPG